MAIHPHVYVNSRESTHLRCHSCHRKNPPYFITLERLNASDGIYDEKFDVMLCSNCAMNTGIYLISDARAASEGSLEHSLALAHPLAHPLDPKLVTKRLSHDHQDELID